MAATFNRALVHESASVTAYETRACGIPWIFAPAVDLGRDVRWPRMWESFGEDAFVNTVMGCETVLGFQGENRNTIDKEHTAVSLKHFMGYGAPMSGKDRTPSSVNKSEMREKHFAPFLAGVRAGALSVMVSSSVNNGLPLHANHEYLTGWLKEDLNWDGVLVSDWADINNLYVRDKIAANKKEAIKLGVNAGIDLVMEPYQLDFCTYLKELVQEGEVKMSRIDDAVRRILRMKFRLGLFEKPVISVDGFPLFGSKQHAFVSLKAAEESMILLKNEHDILPLKKDAKILVTGPNANSMRSLNGGWSYTHQGVNVDTIARGYNTILEVLVDKIGEENVVYQPGVTYNELGLFWMEETPDIDKAVEAASDVDCILVCVGENSYCETPGNITDLTLSKNQIELVKALYGTKKPIILVLNQGRPRIVKEVEPLARAVVNVMLPGNYGGDALANLIVGDKNFSGKLPFSYPADVNSLECYDYKPCQHLGSVYTLYDFPNQEMFQWPFGYGLSYTSFEYGNLLVDKQFFTADDKLTFSVEVTNTGSYPGKETVLLYSSDLVASISPDIRRLRAFKKVELQQGETKVVTFQIKGEDLAFVGQDGGWILEKGNFRIQVGDEVVKIACCETHIWGTPNK
jgi:beta-glucosidase